METATQRSSFKLTGAKLSRFLRFLKQQGYQVDVETYLRIDAVLKGLGEDTGAIEYRDYICPLLARSQKEQERFRNFFDAYFQVNTKPEVKEPPAFDLEKKVEQPEEKERPRRLLAFILSMCLLCSFTYLVHPYFIFTPPEISSFKIPINNKEKDEPDTLDTSKVMAVQVKGPAISESEDILWDKALKFIERYQARIKAGLLLILGILLWRAERLRKQLLARRQQIRPPFVWKIQPDEDILSAPAAQLQVALPLLRRRVPTGESELDLSATVRATVKNAGRVSFINKHLSRPAEYLMLVDYSSGRNLHSGIFEFIYHNLRDNGVLVDRFFYQGDPRVCWNDEYSNGIRIEALVRKYSDHRLLVFGSGHRLVHPDTGKLYAWAEKIFKSWKDKAILTPRDWRSWNVEEKILKQAFILLPSSPESIAKVVKGFEGQPTQPQPVVPLGQRLGRTTLEVDEHMPVNSLIQMGFSPEMIKWIAACAFYPEINWGICLHIGQALAGRNTELLSMDNISRLGRLPWFQQGFMPDEVREQLLGSRLLSPQEEKVVRKTIIAVLEKAREALYNGGSSNTIPSRAYQDLSFQIAVQEALLYPWNKKKRSALRQQAAQRPKLDLTVIQLAQSQGTHLDLILPARLKRRLFNHGHFFWGLRENIKAVLWRAAAILLGIFVWWLPMDWAPQAIPLPAPDVVKKFVVFPKPDYDYPEFKDTILVREADFRSVSWVRFEESKTLRRNNSDTLYHAQWWVDTVSRNFVLEWGDAESEWGGLVAAAKEIVSQKKADAVYSLTDNAVTKEAQIKVYKDKDLNFAETRAVDAIYAEPFQLVGEDEKFFLFRARVRIQKDIDSILILARGAGGYKPDTVNLYFSAKQAIIVLKPI